jgi:hypothetical protein
MLIADPHFIFSHPTFFLLLFMYGAGVEPRPLLLRPLIGLLYQPWMIDGDGFGAISGM